MAAVLSLGAILQFPLLLKQGTDITIALGVVDAAGDAITNPTGWTAKAQIRAYQGGPVLFEWNTTPGAGIGTAVLSYSSGTLTSTLTLTVTRGESLLFTWGSAVWDCYLFNPAGLAACVVEGTVAIDPNITQ